MFGGPATPAVGFGMGDVVLSLVLQDKGVMPSDPEIAAKLGTQPDAFVISNGTPEADSELSSVVGVLRREGLHARRSYKATKNVGKLIQDAAKSGARFCVIVESDTGASLKNLATGDQVPVPIADLARWIKLGELPHAG
jgi:histidyl-tRNA synthetase